MYLKPARYEEFAKDKGRQSFSDTSNRQCRATIFRWLIGRVRWQAGRRKLCRLLRRKSITILEGGPLRREPRVT
ncbi:hypothetical protein BV25DRAFT_1720252 [Artomyces pyxidatus]|uniref:Uncharacterized protein n=1 Tax=Artomyces pyxidatus TaxID=48021 RepID=A0ACB8SHK1_9AGAM|nr:hypothetical protein BV25DRAFT_1720252 [Artomyces pyxidatus]